MEIESKDTQKLIRYAGCIQSSCEFLTYIKHTLVKKYEIQKKKIKTLDAYMQDASYNQRKTRLHFQGLVQLIIELAYFLYSCKNYGISPLIDLEDIKAQESYIKNGDKVFNILIFYQLSDESIQDNFGSVLFKSIMEHIQQALHAYLQGWRENQESAKADGYFQAAFETFWKQFQQLSQNEELAEEEVKFFLYLEQTSLFYQYSMLYRIKSCSLLDYIKTNPTHMEIFKEFKSREENLINNYNQEKKRSKENPQILRAKEKEIDRNLQNFFEKIKEKNAQSLTISQKDQSNSVRFSFKLKQKQKRAFQQVQASIQGQSCMSEQARMDFHRPLVELEYFVEYSSERNSICVLLYLPSIVVNVQTSDFLMFQSNVLTFDAANISIQLSQPKFKGEQKVSKKIVTFKGHSSFNIKEPPLQKILLLMDITMIASRIYEPELNSQKYAQGSGKQSYLKLNNVTKKVSHYTKLFMKCAKQVYDY